jgi:hypothetical protein
MEANDKVIIVSAEGPMIKSLADMPDFWAALIEVGLANPGYMPIFEVGDDNTKSPRDT